MKKENKLELDGLSIEEQAQKIMDLANKAGVEKNFFFLTTFERYLTQLKILSELKESIETDGTLVTKQYVKGRENIYTNPALKEYNNTTTVANRTVECLMRIIKGFNVAEEETDELMDVINGSENVDG